MTQEDKEFLLKDLCARLPYKPIVKVLSFWNEDKEVEEDIVDSVYCVMPDGHINTETIDSDISFDNIVLYLRPMSSMTEEEKKEIGELLDASIEIDTNGNISYFSGSDFIPCSDYQIYIDYLNSNHFDYRGLIEKGLALEAKEGMYKDE